MKYDEVEWEAAACKGINTDLFFLERGEGVSFYPQLRKICQSCPIYSECLEYAVWNETEGFWAATTPNERQRLRSSSRRRDDAA